MLTRRATTRMPGRLHSSFADVLTLLRKLSRELPADNPASHRSDWSADQDAAHAGIIAIAPITFDVRAEKSACEEPAHAAEDGTRHDPCLRSARAPGRVIAGGCTDRSHRIASLVARLAPFAGRNVNGSSVTSRFITLTVGPDASASAPTVPWATCAWPIVPSTGAMATSANVASRLTRIPGLLSFSPPPPPPPLPLLPRQRNGRVVSCGQSGVRTNFGDHPQPSHTTLTPPVQGEKLRRPALDSTQPWNIAGHYRLAG